MKSPDNNDHEFLILTYAELDYLVNRDQLFASFFLEEITELEIGIKYLSAHVQYRDHILPVFDFDAFLQDTFQCHIESLVKFALICKLTSFSEKHRTAYQQRVLQEHPELSSEYIALVVSSQAEINFLSTSTNGIIDASPLHLSFTLFASNPFPQPRRPEPNRWRNGVHNRDTLI